MLEKTAKLLQAVVRSQLWIVQRNATSAHLCRSVGLSVSSNSISLLTFPSDTTTIFSSLSSSSGPFWFDTGELGAPTEDDDEDKDDEDDEDDEEDDDEEDEMILFLEVRRFFEDFLDLWEGSRRSEAPAETKRKSEGERAWETERERE